MAHTMNPKHLYKLSLLRKTKTVVIYIAEIGIKGTFDYFPPSLGQCSNSKNVINVVENFGPIGYLIFRQNLPQVLAVNVAQVPAKLAISFL